jgi:hypothetical protein
MRLSLLFAAIPLLSACTTVSVETHSFMRVKPISRRLGEVTERSRFLGKCSLRLGGAPESTCAPYLERHLARGRIVHYTWDTGDEYIFLTARMDLPAFGLDFTRTRWEALIEEGQLLGNEVASGLCTFGSDATPRPETACRGKLKDGRDFALSYVPSTRLHSPDL